mgnify:CR=1 FL=1
MRFVYQGVHAQRPSPVQSLALPHGDGNWNPRGLAELSSLHLHPARTSQDCEYQFGPW